MGYFPPLILHPDIVSNRLRVIGSHSSKYRISENIIDWLALVGDIPKYSSLICELTWYRMEAILEFVVGNLKILEKNYGFEQKR